MYNGKNPHLMRHTLTMKHTLTGVSILLLFGVLPTTAGTISYAINFTLASGSPLPVSGSFGYDSSIPTFSSFLVTWDGGTFDLTASANSPFISGTPACIGSATGPAATFLLMTACPGSEFIASINGSSNFFDFAYNLSGNEIQIAGAQGSALTNAFASGGFSTQVVPELGTGALTLIGLGLSMRKRIAHELGRHSRKYRSV